MLILIWLGGDLYKLSYYVAHASPLALQLCAAFQIFLDLCILGQFALYKNNTKGASNDLKNDSSNDGEEKEKLNLSTEASSISPNSTGADSGKVDNKKQ